ncbi:phage head closure protein [Rhodobacter capsulatus]|uniref:phage head closure protein n=1 Tax=Rhodobacter capsulatus TaxID=1061 RepID=UPI004028A9A9
MQIAELNKRVALLSPQTVDNGLKSALAYQTVATVWANVKYASDAVRWRANAETPKTIIRVTIRKTSLQIDHKWRLRFGGADYDVDGIKPRYNDEQFYEITAIKRG